MFKFALLLICFLLLTVTFPSVKANSGGGDDEDDEDGGRGNFFGRVIGFGTNILRRFGKKRFAATPADLIAADSLTAKEMHDRCRHHTFDTHLGIVRGHLVLLFAPHSAPVGVKTNCSNNFLFHSFTAPGETGQVGVFQEFVPNHKLSKEVHLHKMGTVKGSHLGSSIFSEALPDHRPYDIVESNCAHKLVHLLEKLDLPISYGVGNFLVENLVKYKSVMNLIRSSPNLANIFPAGTTREQIDATPDRPLVDNLVQYTLKKEYHVVEEQPDYKTATIVLASLLGVTVVFIFVGAIVYVSSGSRLEKV